MACLVDMFRDQDLFELMDFKPRTETDAHGQRLLGGYATADEFHELVLHYPLGSTLIAFAFASDGTGAGNFSDKVVTFELIILRILIEFKINLLY